MKFLARVAARLLGQAARMLPAPLVGRALWGLLAARLDGATARESLVVLFEFADRIADRVGFEAVRYGDGIHPKHRLTRYHEFFVKRIAPGERVLDIGSGNGYIASRLGEAGATVVGIELEAHKVEAARARFGNPSVSFRAGDATRDDLEGVYDVVVMSNVLEHIADRVTLLKRCVSDARAKRVLIRVPLFQRDWSIPFRRELGVEWRSDSTHETEHTIDELQAELAAAGLQVREIMTIWGEIWCAAVPVV
jgi:SAM-dependent methyltransferase